MYSNRANDKFRQKEKFIQLKDGWTILTVDGKASAHFEHTIAITEDGPMILK